MKCILFWWLNEGVYTHPRAGQGNSTLCCFETEHYNLCQKDRLSLHANGVIDWHWCYDKQLVFRHQSGRLPTIWWGRSGKVFVCACVWEQDCQRDHRAGKPVLSLWWSLAQHERSDSVPVFDCLCLCNAIIVLLFVCTCVRMWLFLSALTVCEDVYIIMPLYLS